MQSRKVASGSQKWIEIENSKIMSQNMFIRNKYGTENKGHL